MMEPPNNQSLPFFAYGVFKPGELAFLQVKDLVETLSTCSITGVLRLRDGLPIASPDEPGNITGTLISFRRGNEEEAYRRIGALEPEKQYRWKTAVGEFGQANFLAGRSPHKGSVRFDEPEWNGHQDPLFTVALEVVKETLQRNYSFEWDLKPLFRLEMAYLLLWTAIERYASLRYHLGEKATKKVIKIATEPAFQRALQENVTERREVSRADDPTEKSVLDASAPEKALAYYYQIRSNLVHRGKGVPYDHERLQKSLSELLAIFENTLDAAFEESRSTSGNP